MPTRTLSQKNAKLAWLAFKNVSANIEHFLNGTPFRLPFGALDTLIGATGTIIDYWEPIADFLLPIGQRLESVSNELERGGNLDRIYSTCERFSKVLNGAVEELKDVYKDGTVTRLINSGQHPQRLYNIFQLIDEGTENFELELTLVRVRRANGITEQAQIRLRELRPISEAIYTELNRECCVPGTREAVIEGIMAWCMDNKPDCPPVYWLGGMAGTGKSTIAYTICEKLYDGGSASSRLGASFFCSRKLEATRLRQNIIPTIAHALAYSFPDFGRALLASKFDVQPPPLKDHIQSLLSGPWRSVAANPSLPPLIVVIDAVDELDLGQGSHFMEELIREISRHPGVFQRLRFFITSRQDPRIVKICATINPCAVCRLGDVPHDKTEDDIHLYLRTMLPALSPSTLRKLAEQAFGLFIYAATAVCFINHETDTHGKQERRLNVFLGAWPERSEYGVDPLLIDCLYEDILSLWMYPKSQSSQRIACAVLQTIVCAEEALLVADIPRFLESELGVEDKEVLNLVLSLHAVLYVSEDRVYCYHRSFVGFMLSRTRFLDQRFAASLCPTQERQVCLTRSCFAIMVDLLPSSFHESHSSALRYACHHWAKHMSKTSPERQTAKELLIMYQQWKDHQLRVWMEAMNVLNLGEECSILISIAHKWVETAVRLVGPPSAPESIASSSSSTLPRPWRHVSSTPSIDQLQAIIADRSSKPWKTVEDIHPDSFQFIMDRLQLVLNRTSQMDSAFRTTAINCLQAITTLSGFLPTSMVMDNFGSETTSRSGGAYGDVYFGHAGATNVAVKVIRTFPNGGEYQYNKDLAKFRREALLWYQLRHPRILPLLGVNVATFGGRPCLISPWMENGNVNQFLAKNPDHNRLQMMTEIMEGIHFLHIRLNPPLVHADIRGANILVRDDRTCCLADFGLSVVCNTLVATSRTRHGATRWLAPEIWQLTRNGQEVPGSDLTPRDIYAFGCTAIEICTGKMPFPNISNDVTIMNAVLFRRQTPTLPQTPFLTEEVHTLVRRCLAYEAKDRPDAAEVLECLRISMIH